MIMSMKINQQHLKELRWYKYLRSWPSPSFRNFESGSCQSPPANRAKVRCSAAYGTDRIVQTIPMSTNSTPHRPVCFPFPDPSRYSLPPANPWLLTVNQAKEQTTGNLSPLKMIKHLSSRWWTPSPSKFPTQATAKVVGSLLWRTGLVEAQGNVSSTRCANL